MARTFLVTLAAMLALAAALALALSTASAHAPAAGPFDGRALLAAMTAS